jgi:hypothetical protein
MTEQGGDLRLSEICRVTLNFIDSKPTSYLIPAAEVERFVEASKRLHWRPGRNPHNGVHAALIWQITVAELKLHGPFWWTTPDLQNNGDPAGAHTIDGYLDKVVWEDREYIARCEAEQAEAEAAHWREEERKARETAEGGKR